MGDDDRSPHTPRNDAAGDRKRLDDLDARLRAARTGPEPKRQTSTRREMSFAYRVMVEMIAGLGFGAFVGWWLDPWLGTTPILLVVLILLRFPPPTFTPYPPNPPY